MGRISHREYNARIAYLDAQWNNPTPSDYYLMQIAREIAVKNTKKQGRPSIGKFRLAFKREVTKGEVRITKEQAASYSKATAGILLGKHRRNKK